MTNPCDEARRVAKALGWHPTAKPCECWTCQANRALTAAADDIEALRLERHQLRNELTAAGLENKRLTRTLESVRASLLPYRTGHVKDLAAANIRLIDEALTGAAAEPNPQVSLGPVKVGADLHQCEECGWMKFTPVGESTPEARHRNLCACQACLQERGREAIDNALKSEAPLGSREREAYEAELKRLRDSLAQRTNLQP